MWPTRDGSLARVFPQVLPEVILCKALSRLFLENSFYMQSQSVLNILVNHVLQDQNGISNDKISFLFYL